MKISSLCKKFVVKTPRRQNICDKKLNFLSSHRGLKLDGAIDQGGICNSLKSENF